MRDSTKTIACVGFSCLAMTAGTALLFTGCKPSTEQVAAQEEQITRETEEAMTKIYDLQSEGKLDEALALIDTSLANKRFRSHQEQFFTQKIELLLQQQKEAAAADLILATWNENPALAASVFGRMHAYYEQQNNPSLVYDWCKRLLALGSHLPSDQRTQVFGWLLSASFAMKDQTIAQGSIDAAVSALKPEGAAPLLQSALSGLVDAGQHDLASTLIDYINKKTPNSPFFRNLTAILSMRCILAKNEWDKFPAAFHTCISQLPDDQLLRLLRTVFSVLQRNNRKDLVEQSSKQVIFNALDKSNTVNFASRMWVENGVATDKNLLPERLDALLNAKVSPIQVGNLFDRYFYEMVDQTNIIKNLCVIGDRILSSCNDPDTVSSIKVKVLDGAFIVDNYDLAIKMLEEGIPGKDKTWHEMSLPKVKAHRAMAQKKPEEAIKYFRIFMNAWIASDQEEEYDPTSGIAYSREWILGRNAKRIAGLWETVPNKAEAAKAMDEAKGYFKTALEKAKNDPDALKLLKEETKDMGL